MAAGDLRSARSAARPRMDFKGASHTAAGMSAAIAEEEAAAAAAAAAGPGPLPRPVPDAAGEGAVPPPPTIDNRSAAAKLRALVAAKGGAKAGDGAAAGAKDGESNGSGESNGVQEPPPKRLRSDSGDASMEEVQAGGGPAAAAAPALEGAGSVIMADATESLAAAGASAEPGLAAVTEEGAGAQPMLEGEAAAEAEAVDVLAGDVIPAEGEEAEEEEEAEATPLLEEDDVPAAIKSLVVEVELTAEQVAANKKVGGLQSSGYCVMWIALGCTFLRWRRRTGREDAVCGVDDGIAPSTHHLQFC